MRARVRSLLPLVKDMLLLLPVALVAALGVWLVMLLADPFGDPFNDAEFSQKRWLSVDGNGECVRGTMVDNLVDRHLRKGMRQEDVTKLLGTHSEADTTHWGLPTEVRSVWTFPVGRCSGFKVDCDYLAVSFDAHGRLIHAWHYQG